MYWQYLVDKYPPYTIVDGVSTFITSTHHADHLWLDKMWMLFSKTDNFTNAFLNTCAYFHYICIIYADTAHKIHFLSTTCFRLLSPGPWSFSQLFLSQSTYQVESHKVTRWDHYLLLFMLIMNFSADNLELVTIISPK